MNTSTFCFQAVALTLFAKFVSNTTLRWTGYFLVIGSLAVSCDADMDIFDLPESLTGGEP